MSGDDNLNPIVVTLNPLIALVRSGGERCLYWHAGGLSAHGLMDYPGLDGLFRESYIANSSR